jgi:hypothetical protein
MRQVIGSAVLLAMTFLVGCAGSKQGDAAKAPVAPHISVAMDEETQRALLGEDDLPVGITTLTGADFAISPAAATPAPIDSTPESVGLVPIVRTWGASPDVDGIPTSRE